MAGDFVDKVRPHIVAQLEPGEVVQGVIAATQQKTFSGSLYAIGVTDRRLMLQPLDRRVRPKGTPRSILPEELRSADVEGAGQGWWRAPAVILDASAVALTIRTVDGEKFKLMMMNGTGPLGGLGGGQAQQDGLAALAEWMRRRFAET